MVGHITWIGQGGYILELDDLSVCIDPYLSDSVEEIEGLKRLVPAPFAPEDLDVGYILFTHDHLDHFDETSIRRTVNKNIRYIGPRSCISRLETMGVPSSDYTELNRFGEVTIGRYIIRATYAYHTDDSIGFLIQDGNQKKGGIYFTGDTEYSDELLKVKQYEPKILVCCINGKLGNMDYKKAAELAGKIGVEQFIPSHYGMFAENTEDPIKAESLLVNTGIRYFELDFMKKYKLDI